MADSQPWGPTQATSQIRLTARDSQFTIDWTDHAKEQMALRGLIAGDVLFVLKYGFVYDRPEPSSRSGFYKYRVDSKSPNGGSRSVRVVAIPDPVSIRIKVVTVMWVDDP